MVEVLVYSFKVYPIVTKLNLIFRFDKNASISRNAFRIATSWRVNGGTDQDRSPLRSYLFGAAAVARVLVTGVPNRFRGSTAVPSFRRVQFRNCGTKRD